MAKRDVTNLIERQPELEERVGIRLEGLLAVLNEEGFDGEPRVTILGEILTASGETFEGDLNVRFVCVNAQRQVLGTQTTFVSGRTHGYEAFQEEIDLRGEIAAIKIVPSRR